MSAVRNRPSDLLLPLLRDVRSSGRDSWRATCPNGHQHARGSLAITEAEDGRLLLTCFACYDTAGLMASIGLTLADLYPTPIHDPSPEGRRTAQEAFRRNGWSAALGVLVREATVVLCAVAYAKRGEVLSDENQVRLDLAAERISSARGVLHGR